jgi:hypothetical protein
MLRNLRLATLFKGAAKEIIRAQCLPPEWFPNTRDLLRNSGYTGARPRR